MFKNLIFSLLTTLILCGCSQSTCEDSYIPRNKYTSLENTRGKVIDGFYQQKSFKFKMPRMLAGMKIEEHFDERISAVIIKDDFGNLVRVEVLNHSNEEMCFLNSLLERDLEAFFQSIFKICVSDPISEQFAKTNQLEEKFCVMEGIGKIYFTMIEIPGGSNMIDRDTGRRADSKRAYMLSLYEDQLLVLSAQESMLAQSAREFSKMAGIDYPNNDQELYNELVELRKSYCKG